MDNFVEIAIVLSVIWSVISSIREKNKKKQTQTSSTEETVVHDPDSAFLSDLTKLFQQKPDTQVATTASQTMQEFSEPVKQVSSTLPTKKTKRMEFHKHISHRKSTNSRLAAVKIDEFNDTTDHENHSVVHVATHSSYSKKDKWVSPVGEINAQSLGGSLLLNELLSKPLSLRKR